MDNENVRIIKSSSHHPKDEPTEDCETGSIVSVKEILLQVAMIKKYAVENNDEETWDCADVIERKMTMLKYGDVRFERTW